MCSSDLPADGLEPFLGAWAHVMIIDEANTTFIHAHPMDGAGGISMDHSHDLAPQAPSEIRVGAVFPKPGRYKVWIQMMRRGVVETESFIVNAGQR